MHGKNATNHLASLPAALSHRAALSSSYPLRTGWPLVPKNEIRCNSPSVYGPRAQKPPPGRFVSMHTVLECQSYLKGYWRASDLQVQLFGGEAQVGGFPFQGSDPTLKCYSQPQSPPGLAWFRSFQLLPAVGYQTNLSYLRRAVGLEKTRRYGSHVVPDPKTQRKPSTCWLCYILALSINNAIAGAAMHLLRKPHARIRNGCYAWEMHAELLNERQRGCRKTVWLTASLPNSQLHQILSKGDNWGGEDGQDGSPVPRKFASDLSFSMATCCQWYLWAWAAGELPLLMLVRLQRLRTGCLCYLCQDLQKPEVHLPEHARDAGCRRSTQWQVKK